MTRLLIIDDEIRKAQSLIDYFREICEWGVEIASGPDEALEILSDAAECPFDVIILDVMMDPGKAILRESTNQGRDTGLRLLEMILKRYSGTVKLIVYSARTDLDVLKGDGRIAAYIQKPSSVRDIVREIERLLAS